MPRTRETAGEATPLRVCTICRLGEAGGKQAAAAAAGQPGGKGGAYQILIALTTRLLARTGRLGLLKGAFARACFGEPARGCSSLLCKRSTQRGAWRQRSSRRGRSMGTGLSMFGPLRHSSRRSRRYSISRSLPSPAGAAVTSPAAPSLLPRLLLALLQPRRQPGWAGDTPANASVAQQPCAAAAAAAPAAATAPAGDATVPVAPTCTGKSRSGPPTTAATTTTMERMCKASILMNSILLPLAARSRLALPASRSAMAAHQPTPTVPFLHRRGCASCQAAVLAGVAGDAHPARRGLCERRWLAGALLLFALLQSRMRQLPALPLLGAASCMLKCFPIVCGCKRRCQTHRKRRGWQQQLTHSSPRSSSS